MSTNNLRFMRLLITAGPTHEPIDAVRFLSNRSSGRLGVALANVAARQGCEVTLLLGPGNCVPSFGPHVQVERFVTTAELESLLAKHWPERADLLIMTAAVADYRAAHPLPSGKIPRTGGRMMLELEATPDLVANCALRKLAGQRVIGFALESPENLERRACEKLDKKGLDAVVANPLETMDSETIRGMLIWADGRRCNPPATEMTKEDFAEWLVDQVIKRSSDK